MAGFRPIDPDYDPEKDPDYEAALARYVEANPDSPEAGRWAALGRGGGAGKVPSAVASMAMGASAPVKAKPSLMEALRTPSPLETRALDAIYGPVPTSKDQLTDEELDAAVQRQLGPKENWNKPPAPTPEGEALYADLEAAGHEARDAENDPPLPDVSLPLPGEPPEAHAPAPSVDVKSLPIQVERRTPLPPDAWRVGRAATVSDTNRAVAESAAPGSGTAPPPPTPADGVPPAALAEARKVMGMSPLDGALRASSGNRLIAALTRAGGTAIGRGQGAGYDALDANADAPMREYGLRQQETEKQRAMDARAGDADPASAQSRSAWAMMEELIPGVSAKVPAEGRSAARAKELFPWAKEVLDRDAQRASLTSKGEEARLGRENALKVAAIRARGKGGGKGGMTPAQELQREKFDQSLREKASKDSVEGSELSDTLGRLEGALAKGDDMPGVGRFMGRAAAWGLGSDEDIQVRTDLAKLGNIILHARSGSAVTPSEQERAEIESGTAPGASVQKVQIAGKAAVAVMRKAEANLRAKYPGRTWETIGTEGGWVPGGKGAAPAAAPGGAHPQADAALTWAKAHPEDPRAATILQRLGAQ